MEPKIDHRKEYIIGIIAIFLVLWTEREAFFYSTEIGARILQLVFFIGMSVEVFMLLQLLVKDIRRNENIWRAYLAIMVFQIIAMLPLYSQNFMYGDDLWGFASDYAGDISGGLFFSRPFMEFLKGPLLDTSFQSIKYFRLYNGLLLAVLGCVLFRFIYWRTKRLNISFLFSVLAVSSCFAIDCIAYASVFPIIMSLLSSAISFVLYLKAKESENKKKYILFIVSVICLFNAFNMYQIGTPIVFVMYMIYEKNRTEKDKKRFVDAFFYMLNYGLTAIIYLGSTKIFQIICGVEGGQSARGQFISSIEQIGAKVEWFFTDVLQQTMNRIVGSLSGNQLFVENNMFYNVTYYNRTLELVIGIILIVLITVSIVLTGIRLKSFVYCFMAVVAIPLSFWPFLVLPESYYLSYYAIGLILLILWYVLDGIVALLSIFLSNKGKCVKNIKKVIIYFICSIVVLQSNSYAQNGWVNYCRDSYEYLANSICGGLLSNSEIDTISVQGGIGPYVGGREYVIFCVEDILKELKYNPDEYRIIQNDNPNYISIFNDEEVDHMIEILGQPTMEKLLSYYYHDDLYSRWIYNGQANDETALKFLKDSFIRTEQLVQENEKTLFVNMDGFNYRNKF